MLDVCAQCGQYRPDKLIDLAGPFAVCPQCGYRQSFRQLPLFIVSGASGSGKTTLCRRLREQTERFIALDMDIIWGPAFDTPGDGYHAFYETWLRLAVNLAQAGRPVVLAGSGIPGSIEPCVHRRYFSAVAYLALVCDDAVLTKRLQQRPDWRGSGEPAFIAAQVQFNQWFKDYAGQPPITLLDTTKLSEAEAADRVSAWLVG